MLNCKGGANIEGVGVGRGDRWVAEMFRHWKVRNRNPLLKKSSELFGEESIAFISRMSFLLLISHSQYSHTPSYTTDRSQSPSIQNYLDIFGSNMDPVNDESFLSKNSISIQCKIILFSYIFCSCTLNTPLHLILKIELKNILDNEIALYMPTT